MNQLWSIAQLAGELFGGYLVTLLMAEAAVLFGSERISERGQWALLVLRAKRTAVVPPSSPLDSDLKPEARVPGQQRRKPDSTGCRALSTDHPSDLPPLTAGDPGHPKS